MVVNYLGQNVPPPNNASQKRNVQIVHPHQIQRAPHKLSGTVAIAPHQNISTQGVLVGNTDISISDISSNTELESTKFNALNNKINMNQTKGMHFYQMQKKPTKH